MSVFDGFSRKFSCAKISTNAHYAALPREGDARAQRNKALPHIVNQALVSFPAHVDIVHSGDCLQRTYRVGLLFLTL